MTRRNIYKAGQLLIVFCMALKKRMGCAPLKNFKFGIFRDQNRQQWAKKNKAIPDLSQAY